MEINNVYEIKKLTEEKVERRKDIIRRIMTNVLTFMLLMIIFITMYIFISL